MRAHHLAVYTFSQFVDRADSPVLKDFFDSEPPVLRELEAADGFIARSGYDSDEGPESWGEQVFPKFWRDNGDGWAPSTLSLWTTPEALAAATYHGQHGAAYRRGREWNIPPIEWPGYVLWWVEAGHRPDWREAVERHEHLGDHGPTPKAFTFKQLFQPDGTPAKLESAKVRKLAEAQQRPSSP